MTTTIAVVNEKGGTGKTTTAVNLSAALGEAGQKALLVDLDGQAASSRWLGVEEDDRLADALWRGKGLEPIQNIIPNVCLAPASGKLDSVAHDLRPTQGGQLRKLLAEQNQFDYIIIDCPPSLGNRLIGNALLAASHVIVPVETSILALDGLKILLTTLDDIREGFDHTLILAGVLACRYDGRTRLSRMVLAELIRALPGRVFKTVIRENVRMRECPASGQSIFGFAPDSHAAEDYRSLAKELLEPPQSWRLPADNVESSLTVVGGDNDSQATVQNLWSNASNRVREAARKNNWASSDEGVTVISSGDEEPEPSAMSISMAASKHLVNASAGESDEDVVVIENSEAEAIPAAMADQKMPPLEEASSLQVEPAQVEPALPPITKIAETGCLQADQSRTEPAARDDDGIDRRSSYEEWLARLNAAQERLASTQDVDEVEQPAGAGSETENTAAEALERQVDVQHAVIPPNENPAPAGNVAPEPPAELIELVADAPSDCVIELNLEDKLPSEFYGQPRQDHNQTLNVQPADDPHLAADPGQLSTTMQTESAGAVGGEVMTVAEPFAADQQTAATPEPQPLGQVPLTDEPAIHSSPGEFPALQAMLQQMSHEHPDGQQAVNQHKSDKRSPWRGIFKKLTSR